MIDHFQHVEQTEKYINNVGSFNGKLQDVINDEFLKLSSIIPYMHDFNYNDEFIENCQSLNQAQLNKFIDRFFEKFVNLRKVRMEFEKKQRVDSKLVTKFIERCM
jgi:hypothetical protein